MYSAEVAEQPEAQIGSCICMPHAEYRCVRNNEKFRRERGAEKSREPTQQMRCGAV